jgi:TolB-like protein
VAEVDSSTSGPAPTVFLSYASADREAARALRDALRTLGLEVWYDESELGGGEAWDQKIRKQIRECAYFMPLISAQTEARAEGYFRREWRLAVERTLDMADDHAFLLPVALDETRQTGARVPEKFLSVQWVRAPAGQSTPALEALCRRLVSGEPAPAQRTGSFQPRAANIGAGAAAAAGAEAPPPTYPPMPREGTGSKTHYWLQVIVWALRSGWIFFKQLPRWIRLFISIWLCVVLISRGCSSDDHIRRTSRQPPQPNPEQVRAITDKYHGSFDKSDISKLATQIAKLTSDNAPEIPTDKNPLLAVPFSAPAGNPEAAKLVDAAFAVVYGKIAVAHRGDVGLSKDASPCNDSKAALEHGRSNHSQYVLCGAIAADALAIQLTKVSDGSVVWSKAYPIAGSDPAKIAEEVNAHIPSLDDD